MSGEVREDAYTRHLFSTDASMYSIEPLAVVFPRDADDVAAAVAVCARRRVPMLPRGAGTSLAGQTVGRAVIIDTSRHMDRIVELDSERRTATRTARGGAGRPQSRRPRITDSSSVRIPRPATGRRLGA